VRRGAGSQPQWMLSLASLCSRLRPRSVPAPAALASAQIRQTGREGLSRWRSASDRRSARGSGLTDEQGRVVVRFVSEPPRASLASDREPRRLHVGEVTCVPKERRLRRRGIGRVAVSRKGSPRSRLGVVSIPRFKSCHPSSIAALVARTAGTAARWSSCREVRRISMPEYWPPGSTSKRHRSAAKSIEGVKHQEDGLIGPRRVPGRSTSIRT